MNGFRQKTIQLLMVICSATILLGFMFGCAIDGYGVGYENSLQYGLSVSQPQGQEVNNLTLYMPFPRRGDDPITPLLEKIRARAKLDQEKTGSPAIDFEIVNTEHGKMLKIFVEKLSSQSQGFRLGETYSYMTAVSGSGTFNREPLKPVSSGAEKAVSYVYATWEGPSKIELNFSYKAFRQLSTITQTQEVGKIWMFSDVKPLSSGEMTQDNAVELNRQGWNEVTIWTIERGNVK